MKGFKGIFKEDMTLEELLKAPSQLDEYIEQIRQEKKEKAFKKAVELANQLNSLVRECDITLESIDADGYTAKLNGDIIVLKY